MLNGNRHKTIIAESLSCNCSKIPTIFNNNIQGENECLFKDRRVVTYHPGEIIMKQNTSLTHVVCIKSGIVKQYIESDNGKNLIINIHSEGDIIGFSEILTNNPLNSSISAVTETNTCLIPISNTLEIMKSNSAMAMEVLKYTNSINQNTISNMVNLTQKNMSQKVAGVLLFFSKNIFESNKYTIPLSRQDLADMCSMTKESFIRVIKDLKDSGHITVKGNNFEIIDIESLERISKFN